MNHCTLSETGNWQPRRLLLRRPEGEAGGRGDALQHGRRPIGGGGVLRRRREAGRQAAAGAQGRLLSVESFGHQHLLCVGRPGL